MIKTLLGLMITSSVLLTRKMKYLRSTSRTEDLILFFENLQNITWDLAEAISSSKNIYYERLANMISDPNTSSKAYW